MRRATGIVIVWLLASAAAFTQDWPQWRGPGRTAVVSPFTPPASWPEQLTQRWKIDVGLGYATPVVVGNRIYMWSRQGESEIMRALDAASGAEIWRAAYDVTFTMNGGASPHGPGPKSTPAFADGKLFAIGMTGIVSAFDAATGRVLWRKPGTGTVPLFTTYAMSPVVDRGLVILHVGGHNQGALTAFDVNTGDVKWRWAGDGPSYGSPIVADIAGTRQVITLTQTKLVGVDAASGALLWERPYTTPSTTNAQTPNLLGNTIIFGDAGSPVQAFTIARSGSTWTADVAWTNVDQPMRLSNAVLAGETLFGLSTRNSGQYFALDARTGATRWTSEPRQAAQAAIIAAGDLLFSLENDGELVVIRANPAAFEVVRRYKVADTDTWTPPVVRSNGVFVKDVASLSFWTWAGGTAAAAPRPSTPAPASTAGVAGTDRPVQWASVPAGRFQMGCVPGDTECAENERPRHTVDVPAFRMMTTAVTVGMYRAYAAKNGKPMLTQPDWNTRDDQPVVNVSWADAAAFCSASNARLPTEAEWEYAARAGVEGAVYPWGSTASPVAGGKKLANVADDSAKRGSPGLTDFFSAYDDGFAYTSPVDAFAPNRFGLYDMAGNVWHWTSTKEPAGDRRVIRGGSWASPPRSLRASYRVLDDPKDEDDRHGFRCVS
jgi:outer membrane protein assembly factor BamB